MSYAKTYRVQGIPAAYSKDDSKRLVLSALGRDADDPEPIIHSLGVDPSSSTSGGFQIATVTFKRDPDIFGDDKSQWVLPTTMPPHSIDRASTSSITIDTHFLGFTPLNSFEDGSTHDIE